MFWSVGWPLLWAAGVFCNLDILYRGLGIGKLQFLIKKNLIFFLAVIFFQFLVIKALDPDWIRIRIDLQPLPLDRDPEKMNTDPKHCAILYPNCLMSYSEPNRLTNFEVNYIFCQNFSVKTKSKSCLSSAWLQFHILPKCKFQCCGSRSESGSVGSICFWTPGSFYHQAKIVRKTWFILFCDFFLTFYLWKIM